MSGDDRSTSTPTTASEAVGALIRARIVHGQCQPGQRLVEEELAAELQVSRTSIREALRVLASQGFVVVQPYFGTFVKEMSTKEADDLLELQGALEPLAAGLAATRRAPHHLIELAAIVAAGHAAAKAERSSETSELHGRFHTLLAEASGNESLAEIIVALRHKIDWVYSSNVLRPLEDSWREHEEIVEAIRRGDSAAAVAAAQAHIEHGARARLEVPDRI